MMRSEFLKLVFTTLFVVSAIPLSNEVAGGNLFGPGLPILKPVRIATEQFAADKEVSALDHQSRAYLDSIMALKAICPNIKHDFNSLLKGYNIVRAAEEASEINGISQDLLLAVIAAESRCNVNATSHRGAAGLMQLTPITARAMGLDQVFSIQQNILAGSKYLARLLDKYNGDVRLALAAYNSGPGVVRRFRGLPPYRETSKYVSKVMAFRKAFARSAGEV